MEVHSGSSPDLSFYLDLVAFAPERAEIVSMKRATNGFLKLKVTGPAAAVLAVEATDDLKSFSGIGTVLKRMARVYSWMWDRPTMHSAFID